MTDLDEAQIRLADEEGDAAAARQLGILMQKRGDLDGAEAAFERAATRGDVAALGKLAILIDIHRDDPVAAEPAYRRADEAGSVDGAGNLGRILKERGDLGGAEAAFKRCVERGSVRALADYAGLLSMREDASEEEIVAAVRRLCPVEDRVNESVARGGDDDLLEDMAPVMVFEGMWERCDPTAMEAGVRAADADGSAAGAFRHGLLLRDRGELRAAAEAAVRAGERGYGPAWFNAGASLAELDDLEASEAAFAKAEELGVENAAAGRNSIRGRLELPPIERPRWQGETAWAWATRLERLGDLPGAVAAYDEAMRSAEPPAEPLEMLRQAEFLEGQGEAAEAERAFTRIVEAEDPAIRAGAWRGVSRYRIDRGETEAALEALHEVVEAGDPDETPRAFRNIGVLREEELGDLGGARAAYQAAIDRDHPEHSQGARVNLAQILDREGDHARAEQLLREAIASDHRDEGPRAQVLLGTMLGEQGDIAGGQGWFEAAMAGGHADWAPRAALQAGIVYQTKLGDPARAVDAFRIAERVDDEQQSLSATYLLGDALNETGREEEALTAYNRVVDADLGAPNMARCAAAKQAGVIMLRREHYLPARPLLTVAATADDPTERARGLLLLGSCERGLGNRGAAIAAFHQAASIPGVPGDVHDLARQGLAELGAEEAWS